MMTVTCQMTLMKLRISLEHWTEVLDALSTEILVYLENSKR